MKRVSISLRDMKALLWVARSRIENTPLEARIEGAISRAERPNPARKASAAKKAMVRRR